MKKILSSILLLSSISVVGFTNGASANELGEQNPQELSVTSSQASSIYDDAPILTNNVALNSNTYGTVTTRYFKFKSPSWTPTEISVTSNSRYKNHMLYVYDENMKLVGSEDYGVLIMKAKTDAWYYVEVRQVSQTIYSSNPFTVEVSWE